MKYLANTVSLLSLLSSTSGLIFFFKTSQLSFLLIGMIVSLILDGIDGKIARKYSPDDLKGEFVDSLVDVIVFCFIPFIAILFLNQNIFFFIFGFYYVSMGVMRLARFHVLKSENFQGFLGLPTTISGIIFISLCIIFKDSILLQCTVAVVCGYLMYSKIKFKKVKL